MEKTTEHTIKKCASTRSREQKNDLIREAFQAAGFTHKNADEFIEIDHMEKLYTKGNITVRFIIMDKPEEHIYLFQYHVFLDYADEIMRKKKDMEKAKLQANPPQSFFKISKPKVIREEPVQNEAVAVAPIKNEQVEEQPFIEESEELSYSELTEETVHTYDDDVPDGQTSLF